MLLASRQTANKRTMAACKAQTVSCADAYAGHRFCAASMLSSHESTHPLSDRTTKYCWRCQSRVEHSHHKSCWVLCLSWVHLGSFCQAGHQMAAKALWGFLLHHEGCQQAANQQG